MVGSGVGCFGSGAKPQSEAGSSVAVRALGVGPEQGSQKSSCEAGWLKLCCLSFPHAPGLRLLQAVG